MQKITTQEVKFRDGWGKIHAIRTGTVAVKKRFKEAVGGEKLSKICALLDTQYTAPLPIWVWLIEHPEGNWLVDTGENARVNTQGYFENEGSVLNWINTTQFKFEVAEAEEIANQLALLAVPPSAITQVILTHLHLDHIDGLHAFQNCEILVHAEEWKHPSFALPSLYPDWLQPQLIDLHDCKRAPFARSHALTQAQDLWFIATPGHTRGHSSVLAQTAAFSYLFAGDVSYDQQQLVAGRCAGAHQHFHQAQHTYTAIKQYASRHPTIYLPSHDNEAAQRLLNQEILKTEPLLF